MTKRVLMLARDFPPVLDAGAFRPRGFATHLPQFHYQPIVLARKPASHQRIDPALVDSLPDCCIVHHAAPPKGMDSFACLKSISNVLRPIEAMCSDGDQPLRTAFVDRVTARMPQFHKRERWPRALINTGMELVTRYRPNVLWATAPPIGTLKAATVISQRTGLPLVVDYRDPLSYGVQTHFYGPGLLRYVRSCEQRVLKQARRAVFVSPLTQECMARRYPEYANKFTTITNGLDLPDKASTDAPRDPASIKKFRICFAGTIYLSHGECFRDPTVFLDALQIVSRQEPAVMDDVAVHFLGDCPGVAELSEQRGLANVVHVEGMVDYAVCKQRMREADVLFLLQTISGEGKDVISGKLYEYLASGKTILGVVPEGGGDDWLLHRSNAGPSVGINDADAIARAVVDLWKEWRAGTLRPDVSDEFIRQFDRRWLSEQLAGLFDAIVEQPQAVAGMGSAV